MQKLLKLLLSTPNSMQSNITINTPTSHARALLATKDTKTREMTTT